MVQFTEISDLPTRQTPYPKRGLVDFLWVILFLVLLGAAIREFHLGRLCHQMGVDFRGYYASAQIAREYGFGAVYDQDLQKEYQSSLKYRCPTPITEPPLYVIMPYLPVFVVLFLPFTLIDFTVSYIVWLLVQVIFFYLALYRLAGIRGKFIHTFRLIQWGISIPMITNLYLGQINAWLVWLLVEFARAFVQNKNIRGGLWLSTILMKPHMLILLLPGFVLNRNWRMLLGFFVGGGVIVGFSAILAGFQGLFALMDLTFQFAGSQFQTTTGMMNFRSLALNLENIIPAWTAWLIAALGTIVIFGLILYLWLGNKDSSPNNKIWLVTATLLGTFVVSWHSHFYMHLLLVPLLMNLDDRGLVPVKALAAWFLFPPILYIIGHAIVPALERNIFGLGMLALNLFLLLEMRMHFPVSR